MSALRMTGATVEVLEVLLKGDAALYGLKIAQAIHRPTGSIYPILARLEQLGWVDSTWEPGDPAARGPRRRFYRLNPHGLARARSAVAIHRPTRPLRPRPVAPPIATEGAG